MMLGPYTVFVLSILHTLSLSNNSDTLFNKSDSWQPMVCCIICPLEGHCFLVTPRSWKPRCVALKQNQTCVCSTRIMALLYHLFLGKFSIDFRAIYQTTLPLGYCKNSINIFLMTRNIRTWDPLEWLRPIKSGNDHKSFLLFACFPFSLNTE